LQNFKFNPNASEFTNPVDWQREWNYSFVPLERSFNVSERELKVSKFVLTTLVLYKLSGNKNGNYVMGQAPHSLMT
jgi:hypothetical protein